MVVFLKVIFYICIFPFLVIKWAFMAFGLVAVAVGGFLSGCNSSHRARIRRYY